MTRPFPNLLWPCHAYFTELSLKFTYSLIAPFYDGVIHRATAEIRARSLHHLPQEGRLNILINGIGTGLDLPCLQTAHNYTGIDLNAAMLSQAKDRINGWNVNLVQGNSLALPFADNCFDWAVLHLILAVVPQPEQCLKETARVLKPGGRVLILDKFLRPGEKAPLRRMLNPIARRIATRLDVVFEEVLAQVPAFKVESDEPVLANGWFRAIRLVKE